MKIIMDQVHFVPRETRPGFADVIAETVLPLVDMSQTRGGRIFAQALLASASGRYCWCIFSETFGGAWYESHLRAARERLDELAVISSQQSTELVHSDSIEQPPSLPGFGMPGSIVRLHTIRANGHEEGADLASELETRVLEKLEMHPPNRVGHSTNGQALYKATDGSFNWLVNHTVLESFDHVDTFSRDIAAAYRALGDLGGLAGFEEYQVARLG